MATTIYSNESLYTWGSSGHIKLDASYDYWRNGADMHYSVTAVVKQTSTGSWFNDSVGCQMWLDGVLIYDNSTLKGSTSSSTKAWSRTASVSDATVSNKTTGTTTLRIRVWDSQGAADFNANRYPSLVVSPAMPILSVSTPSAALNYATFTITDSTGQSMTNYEIANSSGTTVQSGTISGSSASIKFTTVAANTRMSHNTTYSGYKIRAKNAIGWGDYVTIPSFKTGNLPNASTSGNFSLGSNTKITISSSNNISAWSVTASDGTSPKTGTGSGTECTVAVGDSSYVNSMLTNHPNDTSWDMYYTVHLYSDGEYLGYVTTQNTCSIPSGNYNPTFASSNISYTDTDTTITGITGNNQKIIKGFSDVKFTVSPMTPGTGATASKYKVSANNATQEANSTGSSLNFTFNNVANNSYSAQAIDSRGKSTTVSGTYSTFIEYTKPRVLTNNSKRTDAGIGTNVNINATFAYYNWTGLTLDNTITEVKYKIGSDSWVNILSSCTISNGTLTINHTTTGDSFSQSNIYTITIYVKDRLDSCEFTLTIPSSQPLLWKDRLNKWLGIKKKPTCALDVDGSINGTKLYYNGQDTDVRYASAGSYLQTSGGTMSGNISFSNSGTAFRGINYGTMGDNDQWRVGGAATASNAGYMEIATADDGNEPIYVRQYTGVFSSLQRTLTLLDGSGNTDIPGTLKLNGTNIFDKIYPIHSIYLSVSSTNPTYLFGGTWVQVSKGRFLLGAGAPDANNYDGFGTLNNGGYNFGVEGMGGQYTHQLTIAEMPSHTHTYGAWKPKRASDGNKWPTADSDGDYTTSATGGNQAHNNMPPYYVVYVWKRTG